MDPPSSTPPGRPGTRAAAGAKPPPVASGERRKSLQLDPDLRRSSCWGLGRYHSADVGQPEDLVRVDPDGVVDGEVVFLEQGREDSRDQVTSRLAPSLVEGLAQR